MNKKEEFTRLDKEIQLHIDTANKVLVNVDARITALEVSIATQVAICDYLFSMNKGISLK